MPDIEVQEIGALLDAAEERLGDEDAEPTGSALGAIAFVALLVAPCAASSEPEHQRGAKKRPLAGARD
jgi:hypothetical protein